MTAFFSKPEGRGADLTCLKKIITKKGKVSSPEAGDKNACGT
ncbi:MAG: hypothetical protein ABI855_07125 [Bacteroidota bacterium]